MESLEELIDHAPVGSRPELHGNLRGAVVNGPQLHRSNRCGCDVVHPTHDRGTRRAVLHDDHEAAGSVSPAADPVGERPEDCQRDQRNRSCTPTPLVCVQILVEGLTRI